MQLCLLNNHTVVAVFQNINTGLKPVADTNGLREIQQVKIRVSIAVAYIIGTYIGITCRYFHTYTQSWNNVVSITHLYTDIVAYAHAIVVLVYICRTRV